MNENEFSGEQRIPSAANLPKEPGDIPADSRRNDTQVTGDFPTGRFATQPSSSIAKPTGASTIDVGSTLGPYQLIEKLGQGGMGAVYKAKHARLRKIVALKILPPSAIGNAEAIARFDREMEAVGKIEHPNIVRAMDAGEVGGVHYLAMEYIEGIDLSKLVKSHGPLKVADACKIILQTAQGLAVAHASGMVHRDIKPANILLSKEGSIKLLDLGLARLIDGDTKENDLTSTGQTFGTPDYMAPEQWDDSHAVDGRTDLYALGCTLFFLLVGRAPYQSDKKATPAGKMRAHLNSAIPSLKQFRAEVRLEIAEIYERLLAKEPKDRVQSAHELVQLLAPYALSNLSTVHAANTTTTSGVLLPEGRVPNVLLTEPMAAAPAINPKQSAKKGRPPIWQWIALAGCFGIPALALAIVITITNREGQKTSIKVNDGTKVVVKTNPDEAVEIASEDENPEKETTTESGSSPVKPFSAPPPLTWVKGNVVVDPGAPLAAQANVIRPAPIPGIRSWSIELVGQQIYASSIVWSPKGDAIATKGGDHSVRLWDVNGNLKSILLGGGDSVSGQFMTYSPDGSLLASVDMSFEPSAPSSLRIWDMDTQCCRLVMPLKSWSRAVAWSPDGRKIAYSEGRSSWGLLDLENGRTRSFAIDDTAISIAWSPDAKYVCVPERGLPTIVDVERGEEVTTLEAPDHKRSDRFSREPSVDWSPDGRFLALGHGAKVRIWDAKTHEFLKTVTTEFAAIAAVSWQKDSKLLAVAGGGGPSVCDIIDRERGQTVSPGPRSGSTGGIAWSPDGTELVLQANVLQFIDGKTGKLSRSGSKAGRSDTASRVAYLTSDGSRLHAKAVGENTRAEFDPVSGELIRRVSAPKGRMVAVAADGGWHAYDVQKPNMQLTVISADEPSKVWTVALPGFSYRWRTDASGKWLAAVFDREIMVWDIARGEMKNKFEHSAKVWDCEFSPDGESIASLAADKIVRVWRTQSNDAPRAFHSIEVRGEMGQESVGQPLLGWSLDGKTLLVAADKQIAQIEVASGTIVNTPLPPKGGDSVAVQVAPDGKQWLVKDTVLAGLARDDAGVWHPLERCMGRFTQWFPDSRRLLGISEPSTEFGVRGYDMEQHRRLGVLWPSIFGGHWVCIGPTGHYRGSEGIEDHIVYVAQLESGSNVTLRPEEFQKRFDWKNDPQQATLSQLEP
jgi:serine/threonine protein kinase/DNA-binding beta-propeller fold protein YncE